MVETLPLATAVTLGGSLLFNLIAFGAPYWFSLHTSHFGLWQSCGKVSSVTICVSNTSFKIDWFNATRAMMVFAMLCVAAATLVVVLFLAKEHFRSKTYTKIIVGTAFASALFALIAISVFGSKMQSATYLGWAYWMALIHLILGVVGGGLTAYQSTPTTG